MSEWSGEGGKREERRGAIERVRESTTPVCEYRWKPQCTSGNQRKRGVVGDIGQALKSTHGKGGI